MTLSVITAAAVQLVYLVHELHTSNTTLTAWRVVLCGQVVQTTSIMTACIPHLKPFLKNLESGLLRADTLSQPGRSLLYRSGSSYLAPKGQSYPKLAPRKNEVYSDERDLANSHELQRKTAVLDSALLFDRAMPTKSATVTVDYGRDHVGDAESQHSITRMICQTTP